MKWAEISIQTTQEAIEAVANILHEEGAGGVIIEDHVLVAYFPVSSYLMETIEQIKQLVINLRDYNINIGKGTLEVSEVDEEEWADNWKKYYKPVKISEKFLITPVWEQVKKNSDEIVIELDPGMAFGTGTHPTTVLTIRALEKTINGGEEIIDVGCGTGILSIAAAKLGAGKILALDLDQVAINSAKLNTKINNVDSIIDIKQNDLLNGISIEADVIVANILPDVIVQLAGDATRTLKTGGIFIASGIIDSKEELVRNVLEQSGLTVQETLSLEDWVAIIAKKV